WNSSGGTTAIRFGPQKCQDTVTTTSSRKVSNQCGRMKLTALVTSGSYGCARGWRPAAGRA
ncbi:hypothetical protein V5799_005475, partial [Amblyomma americanum]